MNSKRLAQLVVKILEAGYMEEATALLSGGEKTAFGWKKLPKNQERKPRDLESLFLKPLMKNKYQRPHISDGRKILVDDLVLQPFLPYMKAQHSKKPLYLLEKGAVKDLLKDLKKSTRWKLWEKKGKKIIFTTKKVVHDRASDRNDLVFVAEILPRKNRIRTYFAHLKSLEVTPILPLQYFERDSANFAPKNTPHDWVMGIISVKEDPDYGGSVLIALGSPDSFKNGPQFPGKINSLPDTTVTELISYAKNARHGASVASWAQEGRPGNWKDYDQRTFYTMYQVDRESRNLLNPEDQKYIGDQLSKGNTEYRIVDSFEFYSPDQEDYL